MYLEVLVIAEHLDNIIIQCHYSKIVFENENLAIFAGNTHVHPLSKCFFSLINVDIEVDVLAKFQATL